MTDAESGPVWFARALARTDIVTRGIQTALGLGGVIGLAAESLRKTPYILGVSVAVVVLSFGWVGLGLYLNKRRPKRVSLSTAPPSRSSYLRLLLPFEKGDGLLGRDQETGQLLALLRSLEFRFGFLSGEAGAGKTSLLRSGVVPSLEAANWLTVYVPRTAGDPEAALRRELLRARPIVGGDNRPMIDLIRAVVEGSPPTRLAIIVDQFEEYFVSNTTRNSRKQFEQTLAALVAADLNVRVLFVLRKEFVDDLLDLARVVPSLGSVQWRLPLRNFTTDTAREIIRHVVAQENLQFSDALQDRVVIDLTTNQRVRPVEFQLVFTTLLEQGVFDVDTYVACGGARGVIARFIGETIEPPESKNKPIEQRISRYVLRTLCDKDFTTRRPIGLSRAELVERLLAEAQAPGEPPLSRREVESVLDLVLQRFLERFILILEDEERVNLAHDYLASPIRDATADIETVEERATRLLQQYLEQQRAFKRVVVPWSKLRYLRRFAKKEMLSGTETTALFRRSTRRHAAAAALVGLGVVALATLALPYGTRYPIIERLEFRAAVRDLSADGRVLAAVHEDGRVTIVRLDTAPFLSYTLDVKARDIVMSPRGDVGLLLGTDGALYQVRLESIPVTEKLVNSIGWNNQVAGMRPWAGFSADGSWLFATATDGWIYAWLKGSRPQQLIRLTTLETFIGIPFDTSKPIESTTEWIDHPVPPEVHLAPHGTFIVIVERSRNLYVLDPSQKFAELPNPLATIESSKAAGNESLVRVSDSGRWLAFSANSSEVKLVRLKPGELIPLVGIIGEEEFRSMVLSFSPDEKWLVARKRGDDFYEVALAEPIKAQKFAAIDIPHETFDTTPPIAFDTDATYVAGRGQDQLVYAWKLNAPPGATAKPVLPYVLSPQTPVFCPQSKKLLISGGDGSLHALMVDDAAAPPRQVGRLAGASVNFHFNRASKALFAHDAFRLAVGTCGEPLPTIFEHTSSIRTIVSDREGRLVIVAEDDMVRLDRCWYLWGIRLWRLGWPKIDSAWDLGEGASRGAGD